MSHQVVRQLKRAAAAANRPSAGADTRVLAQELALSLLSRSITFGHTRLAVRRLAIAVEAGAEISSEHWIYCRDAAASAKDPALQATFLHAAQVASRAAATATDKRC